MENLETQKAWDPEDGVNFDTTELVEVLDEAAQISRSGGDHVPFIYVRLPDGDLRDITKVALVRGDQSDGSHNFEVVIHLGGPIA